MAESPDTINVSLEKLFDRLEGKLDRIEAKLDGKADRVELERALDRVTVVERAVGALPNQFDIHGLREAVRELQDNALGSDAIKGFKGRMLALAFTCLGLTIAVIGLVLSNVL
jgi:hypothetical protein